MHSYVPDSYIVCECCHKYFVSYTLMYKVIDADEKSEQTKAAMDNRINRIVCPHCNSEFTYESVFSQSNRFAIVSNAGSTIPGVASFETACRISSSLDWNFRECTYVAQCLEKMRIFKAGLDDTIIEKLKLRHFDLYKTMDLRDEYIAFVASDGDFLYFEHRDFTDKVIEKLKIPYTDYNKTPGEYIKPATWAVVNRDRVIKTMEE